MRAHQEPVFRLAYLLLGDSEEAEDVAQETFRRARKAFDTERPLRPWLLYASLQTWPITATVLSGAISLP
jgi:DNA-directed RNA polymerase specialized sigma24 family protein